jgi:hypothetical protein
MTKSQNSLNFLELYEIWKFCHIFVALAEYMNFNSREWTFRPEVEGPSVVKIEKADGRYLWYIWKSDKKDWKYGKKC